MTSPEDPRVDEVREQLRALGYLDARVDRFVLAGGRSGARPAALAAAASARIGLLAGVLLGPAAVIGLRARAPGLVTSPGDAVVLALYLTVVFGIAAAAAAGLAILAGGWVARRTAARPDFPRRAAWAAAAAGILVGTGNLVYLVLWWRAAASTASAVPVVMTSAMLVVAVAMSLLLGHVVMVTILALLARVGLGASLEPGLPLSSRRALGALGAAAVAGGVGLLLATSPGDAEPAPQLTVVPTGERVVVLAVDGMDAATVGRLTAAGRLPVLGDSVARSLVALSSDPDRDPARVWTTIATGQPPERHGIRGLESRAVAGLEGRFRPASPLWSALTAATDVVRLTRPAIASGEERLIPSFWEVAASAGLRTAVVHWWATWPAADDLGIVLSDRAILRLEQGGEANAEIAPASLYDTLRRDWPARRDRAARAAAGAVRDAADDVVDVIRRSAELDATLIELAEDPALGQLDLLVLYLPGLDIAQHALLGSEDAGALPPSAAAERLASLEAYYEFLDGALARLIRPETNPPLVVTVAQPGRVRTPTEGFLSLSDGSGTTGSRPADVTSVAPTVLYALGVPLASDLSSGPLLDLFSDAFVSANAVRLVPTYGALRPPVRAGGGRPLDREMIERMRSLGYLR